MSLNYYEKALKSPDTRIELYDDGIETAKKFLSTLAS